MEDAYTSAIGFAVAAVLGVMLNLRFVLTEAAVKKRNLGIRSCKQDACS
jgi:hypothetical protein